MGLAKLDYYDYDILDRLPNTTLKVIRINVDSTNDSSLVDIMSEINSTDGRIYVEGKYYLYLDNYRLISDDGPKPYIELDVEELI